MEGNFEYDLTDEGAVVTKYNGSGTSVIIPDMFGGKPVVEIGQLNKLYGAVNDIRCMPR